jgi:hypothetical protein
MAAAKFHSFVGKNALASGMGHGGATGATA